MTCNDPRGILCAKSVHRPQGDALCCYLIQVQILLIIVVSLPINSLPNDKILYLSKFKGFADDNLNVYQKLRFALRRVEKIVGKGENAGYQHFLLFPQCFQDASYTEF